MKDYTKKQPFRYTENQRHYLMNEIPFDITEIENCASKIWKKHGLDIVDKNNQHREDPRVKNDSNVKKLQHMLFEFKEINGDLDGREHHISNSLYHAEMCAIFRNVLNEQI